MKLDTKIRYTSSLAIWLFIIALFIVCVIFTTPLYLLSS